jgi:NAD(P)-dependent dehydrogenase (short-subunit alcohol dehydrogenase family)
MDLAEQAVVVTGAGSGMGKATACRLARRNARVAALDIAAESLLSLSEELGGLGIECDVGSESSVRAAIRKVVAEFGPPRVLVNCAGIAPAQRISGRKGPHDLDLFQKVIRTNLVGTFNLMCVVVEEMKQLDSVGESGARGVIINTASVAAYEGQIGQAAYSASKGGIVALTLPAARELAQLGIRVVTVAPGLIGTPMLHSMPEEVQASLANQVPFPRRLGNPDEFARLVEHIIDNEMLNGEVIRLDGAIRMQPK